MYDKSPFLDIEAFHRFRHFTNFKTISSKQKWTSKKQKLFQLRQRVISRKILAHCCAFHVENCATYAISRHSSSQAASQSASQHPTRVSAAFNISMKFHPLLPLVHHAILLSAFRIISCNINTDFIKVVWYAMKKGQTLRYTHICWHRETVCAAQNPISYYINISVYTLPIHNIYIRWLEHVVFATKKENKRHKRAPPKCTQ